MKVITEGLDSRIYSQGNVTRQKCGVLRSDIYYWLGKDTSQFGDVHDVDDNSIYRRKCSFWLTGACIVAPGPKTEGIFTLNDELAKEVVAALDVVGEQLWRMPLEESYS